MAKTKTSKYVVITREVKNKINVRVPNLKLFFTINNTVGYEEEIKEIVIKELLNCMRDKGFVPFSSSLDTIQKKILPGEIPKMMEFTYSTHQREKKKQTISICLSEESVIWLRAHEKSNSSIIEKLIKKEMKKQGI